MWVYAIIGAILIYAIYKERQALGCPTFPDGRDCDNANGKALTGTEPFPHDSPYELEAKIRKASAFMERWVVWRFSVILSFCSVMISMFFIHQRIPTETELAIGMFVSSTLIYFTMNFYRFHMGRYVEENVNKGLSMLSQYSK
jgi:hypothetical protein